MTVLQSLGRFFDRLIAYLLQRLPGYRGQADRLLDVPESRRTRTSRVAREADLPSRRDRREVGGVDKA